jgi:DNA invertase Pin-like site-specific DNA recombinase
LERARKQGRVGGRPRLVLDRDRVCRLRNEGKSLREISDTMGLSLTTTARILKTA